MGLLTEKQRTSDEQKTTHEPTLSLFAFLLGMLIGLITALVLTGNPTTDAPPPDVREKKKGKRK
jgi:hypothetical protein